MRIKIRKTMKSRTKSKSRTRPRVGGRPQTRREAPMPWQGPGCRVGAKRIMSC